MTSHVATNTETSLPREPWRIPSWILSLGLHALLLFTLFTLAPQKGIQLGTDFDAGLTVGIVSRETPPEFAAAHEASAAAVRDGETDSTEPAVDNAPVASTSVPDFALADTPPVPLDLPVSQAPPRIGPGRNSSAKSKAAASDLVKPSTNPRAGQMASGAKQIGFLGATAVGVRFAFVVDASGSMSQYDKAKVAAAELLSSLEQLDPQQHFQIVFYNVATIPMRTGERRNNMLAGNDQNKALAKQFIAEQFRPDGGTDHEAALREGLRSGADVIFFLTDGEEPKMSAGELEEVRRLNRGACQIHVIQFGEQAPLKLDSWLKQLARQNGGTYRYRQASR